MGRTSFSRRNKSTNRDASGIEMSSLDSTVTGSCAIVAGTRDPAEHYTDLPATFMIPQFFLVSRFVATVLCNYFSRETELVRCILFLVDCLCLLAFALRQFLVIFHSSAKVSEFRCIFQDLCRV